MIEPPPARGNSVKVTDQLHATMVQPAALSLSDGSAACGSPVQAGQWLQVCVTACTDGVSEVCCHQKAVPPMVA